MASIKPVSVSLLLCIPVISAVLLVVNSAPGQSAPAQSAPERWEYRLVDTRDMLIHPQLSDGMLNEMKHVGITAAKTLEAEFDRLGAEGWEMVSLSDDVAAFKRPKK